MAGAGATLTLILELRRTRVESDCESSAAAARADDRDDGPAEKPNMRNERRELRNGCDETVSDLLTAWQY
jgi:hypothetical protein